MRSHDLQAFMDGKGVWRVVVWFQRRPRVASFPELKGGDSDECADLQQTFYRELLAANGSIGHLDGRADCCCGEIRLVVTTKR